MTRLGVSAASVLLLLLVSTTQGAAIYTFSDPPHATLGKGPVQLEISSVIVSVGPSNLGFTLNYYGAIAPLSQFAPDSVTGNINIDTKLKASAADLLVATDFGGTLDPTKVGYFLDLQSEGTHPGFVDLIDTSTLMSTATLPISFAADSFSVAVPLSDLGNSNGNVNFGVNVGTVSELTDQLAGSTANSGAVVPEPSALAIWGLMLAACAILAVRCRRVR